MPSPGSASSARCRIDDRPRAKASGSKSPLRQAPRRLAGVILEFPQNREINRESLRFFGRFGDFQRQFVQQFQCVAPAFPVAHRTANFSRGTGNILRRTRSLQCIWLQCVQSVSSYRAPAARPGWCRVLRGRRSFAESRPSGGDRRASVSAAACPRERGR